MYEILISGSKRLDFSWIYHVSELPDHGVEGGVHILNRIHTYNYLRLTQTVQAATTRLEIA